jgi:hypothetical protein
MKSIWSTLAGAAGAKYRKIFCSVTGQWRNKPARKIAAELLEFLVHSIIVLLISRQAGVSVHENIVPWRHLPVFNPDTISRSLPAFFIVILVPYGKVELTTSVLTSWAISQETERLSTRATVRSSGNHSKRAGLRLSFQRTSEHRSLRRGSSVLPAETGFPQTYQQPTLFLKLTFSSVLR